MARLYRLSFRRTDAQRDEANRQTTGLLGLAVALALVVAALYLIRHLHAVAAVEDCLLMGRANCNLLVSAVH